MIRGIPLLRERRRDPRLQKGVVTVLVPSGDLTGDKPNKVLLIPVQDTIVTTVSEYLGVSVIVRLCYGDSPHLF